MAGVGREPAGERDMRIPDSITAAESHEGPADQPKPIQNAITYAHAMGQTPGSALPPIANTITKAGPNK